MTLRYTKYECYQLVYMTIKSIITSIFLPDALNKSHHPWDVTPGILLPFFQGIFPFPFYPVVRIICACLFNEPQQSFNLSSNSPELETIVEFNVNN